MFHFFCRAYTKYLSVLIILSLQSLSLGSLGAWKRENVRFQEAIFSRGYYFYHVKIDCNPPKITMIESQIIFLITLKTLKLDARTCPLLLTVAIQMICSEISSLVVPLFDLYIQRLLFLLRLACSSPPTIPPRSAWRRATRLSDTDGEPQLNSG